MWCQFVVVSARVRRTMAWELSCFGYENAADSKVQAAWHGMYTRLIKNGRWRADHVYYGKDITVGIHGVCVNAPTVGG